jgi:1-deoxy-D-xylulose-5-phosphate reductoisomerase
MIDKMDQISGSVKKVAVLGSTGSIGRQTLDIVRALPDKFQIVGLAAGENLELLAQQVREFKPRVVYYKNRSTLIEFPDCHLVSLEEMACHPDVDIAVIATSGKAGLSPVIAAIRNGKKVALANKEPLVMAGQILVEEMQHSQGRILPVDSEHSAIWQCIHGETGKPARILLTASGGPFRHYLLDQLAAVTPEQALQHPSWNMGKKVTIDSATLMNKGLEVIEAHWLFDMPFDNIDILIHPQSIIHSMVEMADGSFKAQLSYPDMRFPIQYALSYPERFFNSTLPELDWSRVGSLIFEKPDYEAFPCLKLAIEAGKRGGTYPAVLCAADEIAVDLFLENHLRFNEIAGLIENVLAKHQSVEHPDLDTILSADAWARRQAADLVKGVS